LGGLEIEANMMIWIGKDEDKRGVVWVRWPVICERRRD
jgi:hypothetical protein